MFYVWFRVSLDTQYVLCILSRCRLILDMFYVWFRVSFDTQYVLCVVSRYHLILDMFYVTFQGCQLGVFIVIVYKAPVSLTSVLKYCYAPDLEKADFDRQSFNILG